ncbi:hypothetical protein BVC80_2969g1 [Macleaya cordata]|uniref:Major facilitator superfamily domain n=1 Tax=Macleaya cordata TaxID=56857 RepID=A0A200R8D1_MACCD|nr:hypothetical protein BVC80_2969g1 [Macleaya cordata]
MSAGAGVFLLPLTPRISPLQKRKDLNDSRRKNIFCADFKSQKRRVQNLYSPKPPRNEFRILLRNLGISEGFSHLPEIGRVRADVKSEPYEITADSAPDSVKFSEVVSSEDVLQSTVPWWEEFPKRWMIVILCFSAFLLCNMDRVSNKLLQSILDRSISLK